MATKPQIIAMQAAKRALSLDDSAYRLILGNAGGVASSKDLDNAGFEACMAVMEGMGARNPGKPDDYWRYRNRTGGGRMVYLIQGLASQTKYDLAGLCRRISQGRTESTQKLTAKEGYDLIEMLKASNARAAREKSENLFEGAKVG